MSADQLSTEQLEDLVREAASGRADEPRFADHVTITENTNE